MSHIIKSYVVINTLVWPASPACGTCLMVQVLSFCSVARRRLPSTDVSCVYNDGNCDLGIYYQPSNTWHALDYAVR